MSNFIVEIKHKLINSNYVSKPQLPMQKLEILYEIIFYLKKGIGKYLMSIYLYLRDATKNRSLFLQNIPPKMLGSILPWYHLLI